MPDQYRRSIAELVTRYEFEPGLRDIYVEGDRDKFLLKWFLEFNRSNQVVVYPIEMSVEVPAEVLRLHGEYGNRGRVIALCKELDRALPANAENIRGLIDKDYSEILQKLPSSRSLLCTDFSCIECYAIGERTLEKFCHLYLGLIVPDDRFREMFEILTELFLLRAAKISLAASAPWVNTFIRLCSIRDGSVTFDRDTFATRLVNASRGLLNRLALDAKVAELRQRLSADFRQQINGHALVQMFSWFAHQMGVDASIYNQIALQRALITSIEYDELLQTNLFQSIQAWSIS